MQCRTEAARTTSSVVERGPVVFCAAAASWCRSWGRCKVPEIAEVGCCGGCSTRSCRRWVGLARAHTHARARTHTQGEREPQREPYGSSSQRARAEKSVRVEIQHSSGIHPPVCPFATVALLVALQRITGRSGQVLPVAEPAGPRKSHLQGQGPAPSSWRRRPSRPQS